LLGLVESWYTCSMTQSIQAIYEHGVFRPLEPVNCTEHERVVLTVSESPQSTKTVMADAEALQRQREALAQIRSEMDSLPSEAPQDGLGGADHDLILYGWKK
jgi:predicted DNA-binding antitoxin AbrB/MazE fold protein